jgi:ribulose-5-phosphate 4-epimerase/fuculose-1-phosphate aldolase
MIDATQIRQVEGEDIPEITMPERSISEERLHRKQRLAAAFRMFSKCGFDEGVAGHITARDPELADHFWVNPFALHFSLIKVSDLILVDHEGNVVEGKHQLVNRAAYAIHSQVHAARPDVVSAAHAHSLYGKTFSAMRMMVEPITQDSCQFFDDHSKLEEFTGVVFDTAEGKKIAHALGNHKAVILQNHGLLTVGHTVDEAAWWFIAMERACQSQLIAYSAGTPIQIERESAEITQRQTGSHAAGWFQFQPLYDRIVKEQPDLLD